MKDILNILMVDDSLSMRIVAGRMVESLGHNVIGEAGDGKEAIQKYQKLKPDVVMLDLVMPKIDGRKTLKKIMELDTDAHVIICSSLGSEKDVESCLRAGASTYLQKPFDPASIQGALDNIFRR